MLDRIGLENYHVRFAEEEIDFMTFLDIKDEHLREMKIPIGPRLKINKEIQRIKNEQLREMKIPIGPRLKIMKEIRIIKIEENALGKKNHLTFHMCTKDFSDEKHSILV